jgi:hypothetical protein
MSRTDRITRCRGLMDDHPAARTTRAAAPVVAAARAARPHADSLTGASRPL